jgi:DNA-binding CsgD family transcriptional regulator
VGNSRTGPKRLGKQEKKLRALDLRKMGLSYREIAAQMGCHHTTVGNYLNQAMDEYKAEEKEKAEDVRELQLMRLDKMLAASWPLAMDGDPKANASVLRIMERQAKLLGLDLEKTKHEVTGKDGQDLAASWVELMRKLSEGSEDDS